MKPTNLQKPTKILKPIANAMTPHQQRNKKAAISRAKWITVIAFLKRMLVDTVLARALKASQ